MTPLGYQLYQRVDLKSDQTLFNLLSFLGSLIFIVLIGLGLTFVPQGDLAAIDFWLLIYIFVGLGIYVVLHEAIHVSMMKLFSKEKISVGFNWRHAFAGMKHAYFSRFQYTLIALAPSILLGILLLILMIVLHQNLAAYTFLLFIIAQNFAGSTGDFYVVFQLSQIKETTLIHDDGLVMSYFVKVRPTAK